MGGPVKRKEPEPATAAALMIIGVALILECGPGSVGTSPTPTQLWGGFLGLILLAVGGVIWFSDARIR